MSLINVDILWRVNNRILLFAVYIPLLLAGCLMSAGCVTSSSLKQIPDVNVAAVEPPKSNAVELPPQASTLPVSKPAADGIIFGKADFRGILKVEYVKLVIVDEDNPLKRYELLFGERDENNAPRWDAMPIEPHYFFLELPAGRYRVTTISIPVGTTLATENADIFFTVEKETVIYLGTLRVVGTDQKIRFGGVPLLRPGFEYRVEIINEKEEALHKFKDKYPKLNREIQVNLMKAIRFESF